MAITVTEAARRLAESGTVAGRRYQDGVRGKGSDWQAGAAAGEDNFVAGIQRAISEGSFGKGVAEAGAQAYTEGVENKGVRNFPQGLASAGPKYMRKVQKFAGLWGSPLPTPRGAKRSGANLQRVQENIQRMINAAA